MTPPTGFCRAPTRTPARTFPSPTRPRVGRLTATDARGTTTYGYDVRQRLASLTYPDGRKLEYGYDANGNRSSLTATGIARAPLATAFTYDDAGRLDLVTDPAGRTYDHGYDANGNRASLAHPNGTVTAYTYNTLNRLTNLATTRPASGQTIQSYGFTLGAAGNRTAITESDGTVRTYTYDSLYRLTGERVSVGVPLQYEKVFTYDDVGNRLTQVTTGSGAPGTPLAPGSRAYVYDTRDRLLTETLGGNPPTSFGYDANGNLITKSAEATYTWDFENRLIRVATGPAGSTTVTEHAYDADGNRVQTKVTPPTGPPVVTNFLVDTSGSLSHVVAETDGVAAFKAYYVRADDLLAVMRPTGPDTWATRFVHADGIGSIRRLTNEAGAITDGYTYTAFGELIAHTGTDPQPYAFAGEPYDPNSGFQYHRARWMDPGRGRFLGMDPFGGRSSEPISLHKYLYAGANPASQVDPSGLESLISLTIGFSMRAVLVRAGVGGVLGGGDSYFSGGSIPTGIVAGALGGVVAPFVPLKIGLGFTAYGVGAALYDGDYDSALYRAATFGFGYLLQTRGFAKFEDFKKFWGPAGRGRAWHHIVEQTAANIARFGATSIHNPSNMVPLAHYKGSVHMQISGLYKSNQQKITGHAKMSVRQWLSTKSFAEQYQFGLEAMARVGAGSGSVNVSGTSASWFWPAVLDPFDDDTGFGQDDEP